MSKWVLNQISLSTELTFIVFHEADEGGMLLPCADIVASRVKIPDLVMLHVNAFFFSVVTYGQRIATWKENSYLLLCC